MISSVYFTSPEIIQNKLVRRYRKIKEFHIDDIVEWCGDVETNYINDVDLMVRFKNVPLTVTNGNVLLPCNIHRIIDVYTEGDRIIDFKLNSSGAYMTDLKYHDSFDSEFDETTIYLNYVGIPVDPETGYVLIAKGHEIACETFCLMRAFEEDVAMGKFNMNFWARWEAQFPGQIINALSNPFRHKTQQHLKDLETIRFNALPRIGKVELSHEMFDDNGVIVIPEIQE